MHVAHDVFTQPCLYPIDDILFIHVLEIMGEDEVEKVKILNLDEDEEYELFVDAVLIIE